MNKNLSRLIWEGFLEEWFGLPNMPWSETRFSLAQRVPACLLKSHVLPQSHSQDGMCSLEHSSNNYALLAYVIPGLPAPQARLWAKWGAWHRRDTETVTQGCHCHKAMHLGCRSLLRRLSAPGLRERNPGPGL